jgi:hypothetical protein
MINLKALRQGLGLGREELHLGTPDGSGGTCSISS